MFGRKVLLLLSVILMIGCERIEDVSEDNISPLTLSVKSSASSIPVTSLKVWAFDCDVQGHVRNAAPIGYASAADEMSVTFELETQSRYCILLAGANLPPLFSETSKFQSLSTTMFSGLSIESIATHWKIVDLTSATGDMLYVPMEVFPTFGRISVNVSKESEAMNLRVNEVSLHSAASPEQGTFWTSLTADQIKAGGLTSDSWYFNSMSFSMSPLSRTLAEDVDVTESRKNISLCCENVYENQAGWTNLAQYRESGWTLSPAESDPDCNGYYLSVSYTYSVNPVSLDSDAAVTVQKFIPLAPVCRSNEYRFDIRINLDEITVFGSTETSEEVEGIW